MTAFAPSSTALVIAIVMPRSLNDPVGLAPSTLSHTSQPVRRDSSPAGTTRGGPSCSGTPRGDRGPRSRGPQGPITPRPDGGAGPPRPRPGLNTPPTLGPR